MKKLSLYVAPVLAGLLFIGSMEASARMKSEHKATLRAFDDLTWEPPGGDPPASWLQIFGATIPREHTRT
jgi:hypothetical protein